ncbi:MAG: SDR family NAD(P)-dependent oxidoreductase, partial [Rhizobiaceae bacterium]|nr:SDR family NAD(P)-dependent oxidoreductase [Rhizobiaceae bacterium]
MSRTAIVTGASRGIGRAIAVGLANRGYDLALNDIDRQKDDLNDAAEEVRGLGRKCVTILADVSDASDCKRAVAEAISGLGHIDVLVNNAGILKLSTI